MAWEMEHIKSSTADIGKIEFKTTKLTRINKTK